MKFNNVETDKHIILIRKAASPDAQSASHSRKLM